MSFRRYPAYKESGVGWLGSVPAHWPVVQSRRLFSLRNERARESDRQLTASQEYGVIYQDDFVRLEGRRVVEVIKGAEILKHVDPDDFVISMRSFQGGIEWCRARGCISSAYVMLEPGPQVHGPFFAHLFKSGTYIQALQTTTNLVRDGQALRFANFAQVPLPLVPREEQIAIAAFLDRETGKIDALVAEQERLIELLKEKRQAVISHAVIKGLNPDAPMKDSGIEWLGAIPAHWTAPPLYTRYEQALGKMLDQSKQTGAWPTPYLRNIDVRWGYFNVDDLPVIDIRPEEKARFTVRSGDLLMVEGRDLGRCAIWTGEDDTIGYQKALHRLRPRDSSESPRYFYYLMHFASVVGVFFADQLPNEIPHLTGEELRRHRFPKPPLVEQIAIAEWLDGETSKFDKLIAEVVRGLQLLQERRSALISAAVTGQIDVRSAAARSAA